MDAALRLASLVVAVLETENRVLSGITVDDMQRLMGQKEEMGIIAAGILEREDRWTLTPLALFDSNDN